MNTTGATDHASGVLEGGPGLRCCSRCHAIYRSDFIRCPTDGAEVTVRDTDPLIGQTIGEHYVIDACVGEGAMGRVYRAHHHRLEHREYALKVLLGDFAATVATRIRFTQEAESASRLAHPNLVPVLDFGKTTTGLLYLAMEFVTGPSLATVIERAGPLAPTRAIGLARQLALGLAHAHERGLVHRDFKPDNILVVQAEGKDELPRIVDFGLAITADPESSARLTTVGLAVGTPVYAAPEQVAGGAIDHRADLFAFGVTLYEMLSGKVPFDGGLAEVLHLNATTDPPPIAERSPGVTVPPSLEAVVRRLMARAPSDRYPSALEVVAALDAVDLNAAIPHVAAARGVVRVRRTGWAAAILLAIAAVVGSVIAVGRGCGTANERGIAESTSRAPQAPIADAIATPATVSTTTPAPAATVATTTPAPATPKPTASPPPATQAEPRRRGNAPGTARRDPRPTPTATPTATPPLAVAAPLAPIEPAPTPSIEPAPAPAPKVAPKPKPTPVVPRAVHASIGSLDVDGSLSDEVIRLALSRVVPALEACYLTAAKAASRGPSLTAKISLEVDDTRRAGEIQVGKLGLSGMNGCVVDALAAVRTRVAPDVGVVRVACSITFTPEVP